MLAQQFLKALDSLLNLLFLRSCLKQLIPRWHRLGIELAFDAKWNK